MNSDQLRSIQMPIKQEFRNNPEKAKAVLQAHGKLNLDTITCEILRDRDRPELIGLHEMAGGDGSAACAGELLLEAVLGCAGVTFAAVSTAMSLEISSARVTADGEMDFRGTLGVSRDVPVGFEEVRIRFMISSSESDDKITKAVELAERYCVVAQTLKSVKAHWERVQENDV